MFSEIRTGKLLTGYRGMPPVNLSILSRILQSLGQIALLHPEIAEIDINPLIIRGDEPVAADALIILKAEGAKI